MTFHLSVLFSFKNQNMSAFSKQSLGVLLYCNKKHFVLFFINPLMRQVGRWHYEFKMSHHYRPTLARWWLEFVTKKDSMIVEDAEKLWIRSTVT